MSTPEAQVTAAMAEKREAGGDPPCLPAAGLPGHAEAMDAGREAYPEGQRGR